MSDDIRSSHLFKIAVDVPANSTQQLKPKSITTLSEGINKERLIIAEQLDMENLPIPQVLFSNSLKFKRLTDPNILTGEILNAKVADDKTTKIQQMLILQEAMSQLAEEIFYINNGK